VNGDFSNKNPSHGSKKVKTVSGSRFHVSRKTKTAPVSNRVDNRLSSMAFHLKPET
jgi:hypothetical protein